MERLGVVSVGQALLLALAVSAGANALLAGAWLSQRDKTAAIASSSATAVAAAEACTAAVQGLSVIADQRVKESAAARGAAREAAGLLRQRADRTLAHAPPPPTPAEACGGMQTLGDGWLKERGQ